MATAQALDLLVSPNILAQLSEEPGAWFMFETETDYAVYGTTDGDDDWLIVGHEPRLPAVGFAQGCPCFIPVSVTLERATGIAVEEGCKGLYLNDGDGWREVPLP